MMDFHDYFDDYFVTIPDADDRHRRFMTELLKYEGKRVFVFEDDRNLLGYLVVMIKEYPPIYEHNQFAEINAISVTESARRKGNGQKLLEAALAWCRKKELKEWNVLLR